MKTRSYFGQPRQFGPGDCDHIGNIVECEEWLLGPKEFLSGEKPMAPVPINPTVKAPDPNRCICRNKGDDGTSICSALPHEHRLQTRGSVVVVCENHLNTYLRLGFSRVQAGERKAKACWRCVTNAVSSDSSSLCEVCDRELNGQGPLKNDALRLKEEGYCVNRNTVHGCTYYTEPGENLCRYCKNYMGLSMHNQNPRIRTVPTSARPCRLTPSCAGTMTANVRRYSLEMPPDLWWVCALCKAQKVAERTMAVPDAKALSPDALAVMMNEGGSEGPEGLTDLNDVAAGIRAILLESDDG